MRFLRERIDKPNKKFPLQSSFCCGRVNLFGPQQGAEGDLHEPQRAYGGF